MASKLNVLFVLTLALLAAYQECTLVGRLPHHIEPGEPHRVVYSSAVRTEDSFSDFVVLISRYRYR